MQKYHRHVVNRVTTPQHEPARADQVQNDAGGYTFHVTPLQQLRRFLILGSASGTYYVTAKTAVRDNEKAIQQCLDQHGEEAVAMIIDVSHGGWAKQNDGALFALAIASAHPQLAVRQAALAGLPKVARTFTHVATFLEYVKLYRGWGRGLRHALQRWWLDKTAPALAYQTVKYRNRAGWTPSDALRKTHPVFPDPERNAIARYLVCDDYGERRVERREKNNPAFHRVDTYASVADVALPGVIEGFERARRCTRARDVVPLIEQYQLTWEMLPTALLNERDVWDALLPTMPLGALLRNLNKLTAVGTLDEYAAKVHVTTALTDEARLQKARIHPISILIAAKLYAAGHGDKGTLTWQPHSAVVDALDAAFYHAFVAVTPIHKPVLLALDISSSMMCGTCAGASVLTPMEASAAFALVTVATEPTGAVDVVGFNRSLTRLDISPRRRLDDVIGYLYKSWTGGGTDCAQPMLYAMANKRPVDLFVMFTDNETWAGTVHPHQALQQYRQRLGRNARAIVCATEARSFTIADPSDAGMLDIAGFGSDTPATIAGFGRGEF